jgi:hypothetical protein
LSIRQKDDGLHTPELHAETLTPAENFVKEDLRKAKKHLSR